MKKIFKLLSIIAAAVMLIAAAGCANGGGTLCGIVGYDEDFEWLVVEIPGFGEVMLSSKQGVDLNGNTVDIAVGDVVKLDFKKKIYIRRIQKNTESGYVFASSFVNAPKTVTVGLRGLRLEENDESYTVFIPLSALEGVPAVGKSVAVFTQDSQMPAYSAVIANIDNDYAAIETDVGGYSDFAFAASAAVKVAVE